MHVANSSMPALQRTKESISNITVQHNYTIPTLKASQIQHENMIDCLYQYDLVEILAEPVYPVRTDKEDKRARERKRSTFYN